MLRRSGRTEVLDLCSGSGGPLLQLRPHLDARRLVLSDRHPPRVAGRAAPAEDGVSWLPDPLDARAVPPAWTACRTLFTSFHHFGPADARRILESAVRARAPIAVFEFTDRRRAGTRMAVSAPLAALRDTWRMRPLRWGRLLLTYVVPVLPLLYAWDAVVSHHRTYTAAELSALTAGFPGHSWEVGTIPAEPAPDRVTYLIGLPRPPAPGADRVV